MDALIGQMLGAFQVVAPLGAGGMAQVYKAYQPSVGRYVALKVLPRAFAEDPAFVARFEQEARLVANLEHPNIVPVYDFGQASGYMYIAMRLMTGGSLHEQMSSRPMALERIRSIMAQVGDALDYAHSRGVVHRDLKPSNILLDDRGHYLLSDFGIAKTLAATMQLTTPGDVLGTASYMSPEQGLGRPVDARSDIYALGVILYRLATGRVPFEGPTPLATAVQHVETPPPAPSLVNPAIPPALEQVILTTLAKDPNARYATAGEFVAAVNAALPGVAPAASTPLPAVARTTPGAIRPAPVYEPPTTKPPARRAEPPYAGGPDQPDQLGDAGGDEYQDDGAGRMVRLLIGAALIVAVLCIASTAIATWVVLQPLPRATDTSAPPTATVRRPSATPTATATVTPSPTPTLSPTVPPIRTRPSEQGLFRIARAGNITLDGQFDDWNGNWLPIGNVVFGENNYGGGADLSGSFQAAWAPEGLYLAIQVVDDRFFPVPSGDQLFKGDGIELLFDRALQADFDTTTINEDDYQIGFGMRDAGSEVSRLNAYRWIPQDEAGSLTLQGAGWLTAGGYQIEALVPWSAVDATPSDLPSGGTERLFGFTLSINDNDSDQPAQETVISTSPARSVFNLPGTWGTLILLP
jgi:hypothetical protein